MLTTGNLHRAQEIVRGKQQIDATVRKRIGCPRLLNLLEPKKKTYIFAQDLTTNDKSNRFEKLKQYIVRNHEVKTTQIIEILPDHLSINNNNWRWQIPDIIKTIRHDKPNAKIHPKNIPPSQHTRRLSHHVIRK